MCWINYVSISALSSHSTLSGCALIQRHWGQTVLQQQQLHQIAESLSQLYLSTSGTEGQNLGIVNPTPQTLLRLLHMAFSTASCNIRTSPTRHKAVRSRVWLRAACTMSNCTCCEKCHCGEGMSDLGTFAKSFRHMPPLCRLPFC